MNDEAAKATAARDTSVKEIDAKTAEVKKAQKAFEDATEKVKSK